MCRLDAFNIFEIFPCTGTCVCVCFLPIHSGHQVRWTYQPGSHRRKGHTGFLIHLLFAVRAFIFLARRIQPFLSLVDREVEFLRTSDLIVLHPLGIFIFIFWVFSEKNTVCRDRTHVPTCQKVTWIPLSYRGDRLCTSEKPAYDVVLTMQVDFSVDLPLKHSRSPVIHV